LFINITIERETGLSGVEDLIGMMAEEYCSISSWVLECILRKECQERAGKQGISMPYKRNIHGLKASR
jgi:hypothetical protein